MVLRKEPLKLYAAKEFNHTHVSLAAVIVRVQFEHASHELLSKVNVGGVAS